jgi:hypothetical protein
MMPTTHVLLRAGGRSLLVPTKRQLEILRIMRDAGDSADGELVYERGRGFLGTDPVAARTVLALLRLCAISADQFNKGDLERFHINDTGKELLKEHKL